MEVPLYNGIMDILIEEANQRLLQKLSIYLNEEATTLNPTVVGEYCEATGCTPTEGVEFLCAALWGLDKDPELRRRLPAMLRVCQAKEFQEDPYLKNLRFKEETRGSWRFATDHYDPYELFVCDDFKLDRKGRIYPQLGYFEETYFFPSVLQDNRIWMTITPNEINTMAKVIEKAEGKVLTYGLGLGYFLYRTAMKAEVKSVTVIERDPACIELFEHSLQAQFPMDKIHILQKDAFDYAQNQKEDFDLTFVDLWHDVGDGLPLYQKFKTYEKKNTYYWIEDTLKAYLD